MAYVGIVVGHRSFTTGQYCLVKVNKDLVFIRTYAQEAFELACEHLKLPKTQNVLCWIIPSLGTTYTS